MCRYADHIDAVFGPGRDQKRGYPGHEEIELALVKLFRITGNERYLRLSEFFINERGQQPHYFDIEAIARGENPDAFYFGSYQYNQSHLPVREQTDVVGHSVRAMYLYSGMADVATETGDRALAAACKRLWKNLTQKRMHITGGIGPTCANEGFTQDYDLPNQEAYLETCAAIGLVFWAHRMLHMDPDSEYADVMERALYNGVISGVSLDGRRFFYGNPLAAHPGFDGNGKFVSRGYHYRRSDWFACACCPPNIARLLASLPGYICSEGRNEARVHLYVQGKAELELGGQMVELIQRTAYPWKEKVSITVRPEGSARFNLALRIPGWCRGAGLKLNGRQVPIRTTKGYVGITREWNRNDKVELLLPMPVERIEAHPRVRQNAGRIALQRGPVVYCLEEADNGGGLHNLILSADAKLTVEHDSELLGGVSVIKGRAHHCDESSWKDDLYRPESSKLKTTRIRAVPYATWGNRTPGEMIVWVLSGP
jgi:DUF1680 family protein